MTLPEDYFPVSLGLHLSLIHILALLDAAQRFEPSMGTRMLTYATPAIETAMKDCAAQSSFSLSFPLDRYYQLRQVAFLYAAHEQDLSLIHI